MQIVLLEPFYTGSHKAWAQQLAQHSRHTITILSMEGRYWKWRMHGAAITLAEQYRRLFISPDLILATDMLDLSSFLGLTRDVTASVPVALYFHENQMVYPVSKSAGRNNEWRHYAFINYISALTADKVFFNSSYNLETFHREAYELLKSHRDHNELETIHTIRRKSEVLPLGLNLQAFDKYIEQTRDSDSAPLVIWNHRWEHDKDPDTFTRLLLRLYEEGYVFRVALMGEVPYGTPKAFEELRATLGERIVHFGYAEEFATYASLLAKGDLLPVTSDQDFFGGSTVEAIYCGCYPLLPNQLAYPEHLPLGETEVLYHSYEELIDKMRKAMDQVSQLRKKNRQHWVAQYDWHFMSRQYDDKLEQLAKGEW